jgi:hypothetical protein
MKNFIFIYICLLIVFGLSACSRAGMALSSAFNPDQFNPRHFTFIAKTALPSGIPAKILSAGYDVKVRKDTVESYLPYYGVSQSAPMSSDEAGIRFTTTAFSLSSKKLSAKGWEVAIQIKDQKFIDRFLFTIYKNGAATLFVSSNFRSSISFDGEVRNE